MKPVRVVVSDRMQKSYVYYRTKPMGSDFRPEFKPELTPKQMLALGVFGGKYLTDCRAEFPGNWFVRAKFSKDRQRASLNYFGVNASQPLEVWRQKGWIHPDDPRGWFQWYCRYYSGRRHEDDLRQVKRWRAVNVTWPNSGKIARGEIWIVAGGNGRPFCTGPTIHERFERYLWGVCVRRHRHVSGA